VRGGRAPPKKINPSFMVRGSMAWDCEGVATKGKTYY